MGIRRDKEASTWQRDVYDIRIFGRRIYRFAVDLTDDDAPSWYVPPIGGEKPPEVVEADNLNRQMAEEIVAGQSDEERREALRAGEQRLKVEHEL